MTYRITLAALLFIIAATLCCDQGSGNNPGTTPELLQDTFRAIENPAEEDDVVEFQVAFEDLDGDMRRADLVLDFIDPDGFVVPVELDDRTDRNLNNIVIEGTKRGTIRFELTAESGYDDGVFELSVIDLAGHQSNVVTLFFYVNLSGE